MVPKLVETIVIMRSNKGKINFSDYTEENEESSSSDEEDVESEPEGETVAAEEVEMEDNGNDSEVESVSVEESSQLKTTKKKADPVLITKFFSPSQCVRNSSISQEPVAGPSRISQEAGPSQISREAGRKNKKKAPSVEKLIDAVSDSDSETDPDNVPAPQNTQQKQWRMDDEIDVILNSEESDSELNVVLDVSAMNAYETNDNMGNF